MLELPQAIVSALREGRAREVARGAAQALPELYGRALARLQVGDDRGAEEDLRTASALATSDAERMQVEVEQLYLAIRSRSDLRGAADRLQELASEASRPAWLRGRARHYLGLARGKMRQVEKARTDLLEARALFASVGDRGARAQATDTLGMLYAAEGRLDLALSFFALALVDKLEVGDRYGTALTLGNLGRAHLRGGRVADALECFAKNRALCEALGDERGRLRALEDEARTRAELREDGERASAEAQLREVIAGARAKEYRDLEFFAQKDLALLLRELGRLDEAERALDAAIAARPTGGERYHELLLQHAQALLGLSRGQAEALALLRHVVTGFQHARLPDLEISAREALARALAGMQRRVEAAQVLEEAIELARGDGFERLRVRLIELFRELELQRGFAEERGRLASRGEKARFGYDLLDRLGGGAFGEVYKAFDPQRMQLVALKRLRLDELYDAQQRGHFLESARSELAATRAIFHPGVARVHAIGVDDDGGFYIVQDYVPGVALANLIKTREPARLELALPILVQLAQALDAIHSASPRVIHRDVKPDNVILVSSDAGWRPVLVDFGLAYFPQDERFLERVVPAGTPAYAAPEQMSGKLVTPAADLYALGVIAYEWFAAVMPIPYGQGESSQHYARRIEREVPRPLAEFRPDLPRELCARIDRLLAKKPHRRGTSAAELADELARYFAR